MTGFRVYQSGKLARRVYRGIALLDARLDGVKWWNRIDTDTLDVSRPSQCILGQVFRTDDTVGDGYDFGADWLNILYDERYYGFEAELLNWKQYRHLTRIWAYAIRKRQAAELESTNEQANVYQA